MLSPPPLLLTALHLTLSSLRVHKLSEILVARRVTGSKLQTEHTQTLGATLHNLVALATLQLLQLPYLSEVYSLTY